MKRRAEESKIETAKAEAQLEAHVAEHGCESGTALRERQVGLSVGCVRAMLRGVSEPVNSAQKYPPTSGHRP